MTPRGFTGKLADLSSRSPWKVVGIWVVIFVIAGLVSAVFPADMTTDANFTNDPESVRADNLIAERMDSVPAPDELVVVKSDTLTVDDPAYQSFVEDLTARIQGVPDNYVSQVANYYQTGDAALISDDQHAMVMPVFFNDPDADAQPYLDVIDETNQTSDFTVATGGNGSIDAAFEKTSESDLLTGETLGISVALIVLILVFGTLVSAGIPLVLAITSIGIAVGITMIIGNIFNLSIFVTNMLVMIGLAVGIDYALFIIGRYREERAKGMDGHEAIVRTGDTASKAVLFSGMTVVIALLGMLIVPSSIFKSLGTGAIVVVIVAIAATLTLLPAVLQLLSGKIRRGTGRTLTGFLSVFLFIFATLFEFGLDVSPVFTVIYAVLGLAALIATVMNIDVLHLGDSTAEGGFWDRITRFVMKYPVPIVTGATIALVAIAVVYFTINLGQSGISTLPEDTTARQALTILGQDFSGMSVEDPTVVVVDASNVNAPEIQDSIQRLEQALSTNADFGPSSVQVNQAGNLALVSFPSTHDSQSSEALDSVKRLRADIIPSAFGTVDADVLVAGPTAETIDFDNVVNTYTPIVFVFVLGMSLILLLLAFRSIVLPIKSIIMNLLSVGASYGLLVAVFQHGIGNEIFGFKQVERIEAWIPLMMFTILFGLSMDYHVFLLSRIKEHYDETGRNTESVAYGLRTTASIITGAALIMVAVFGGFAMGELSMFQQMGFGLATAVFLDATVIRILVVPAAMKLLKDWNWYYPNWLNWLPSINVEGVSAQEPVAAPQPEPAPAD